MECGLRTDKRVTADKIACDPQNPPKTRPLTIFMRAGAGTGARRVRFARLGISGGSVTDFSDRPPLERAKRYRQLAAMRVSKRQPRPARRATPIASLPNNGAVGGGYRETGERAEWRLIREWVRGRSGFESTTMVFTSVKSWSASSPFSRPMRSACSRHRKHPMRRAEGVHGDEPRFELRRDAMRAPDIGCP